MNWWGVTAVLIWAFNLGVDAERYSKGVGPLHWVVIDIAVICVVLFCGWRSAVHDRRSAQPEAPEAVAS